MDRTTIEKIAQMAEPNFSEHGGFEYTDKPITVIRTPEVEGIAFKTLAGISDTLIAEEAMFDGPMVLVVEEHNKVSVMSAICTLDRQREHPYTAVADTPDFAFGRFMPYESMMIALKSKFVETPALLELVKLLGTITEENNTAISDDGFTQSVVIKKGIALKEGKAVSPKVKLTPYRTFIEVKQPESEFLLRLQEGGQVALFEADGGAWKLEARAIVGNYLRNRLVSLIERKRLIIVE